MINPIIKYSPIAAIVLLLLVIGFFMIKNQHEITEEFISENIDLENGLKAENMHSIYNLKKGVKLVLDAKKSTSSKDMQRISFKDFQIELESEGRPSIQLNGKEGDWDRRSGKINLWGNLHGQTDDGYEIITQHLFYKEEDGCLKTEAPVKIIGPFLSSEGKGLIMDIENETLRIISNVTTLIDKDSLDL